MGRIKEVIEEATGAYVISLQIGQSVIDDTINGFLKPVNKQVKLKQRCHFQFYYALWLILVVQAALVILGFDYSHSILKEHSFSNSFGNLYCNNK